MKEGQPIHFKQDGQEFVATQAPVGAEVIFSLGMRPNKLNHNKNLHGAEGVEGFSGFYHGKFYDRGVYQAPKIKGGENNGH